MFPNQCCKSSLTEIKLIKLNQALEKFTKFSPTRELEVNAFKNGA